jgi:hypothetical protein
MTSKTKKKRKTKISSIHFPIKVKPPSHQKVESVGTSKQKGTLTTQEKSVHTIFTRLRRLIPFDHYEIYEQIHQWWLTFAKFPYKLSDQEHRLANFFRRSLNTVIGNAILLLIFTLVGLNSPASYPPLFTIIHEHNTISIIIIILIALYFVRVLLVGTKSEQEESKKPSLSRSWYLRPILFLNALSYTSSIFLLFVLLLLLIRPAWCPTPICPTQQRILIFHQQSTHDDNLEMYFIANQSSFYAIPDDPAQYTRSNLPMSITALHTDGENSMLLYHLIIGLNSLQQGHFGMIIEKVNLIILKVAPIPHPLNVWNNPLNVYNENENQYRALYLGQQAGAVIPADYLRIQFGFVQLKPGETDQIDLHVISRVEANIWFTVQVVYRIANKSQLHTLRLSQQFEVMFANKLDWHLYQR